MVSGFRFQVGGFGGDFVTDRLGDIRHQTFDV